MSVKKNTSKSNFLIQHHGAKLHRGTHSRQSILQSVFLHFKVLFQAQLPIIDEMWSISMRTIKPKLVKFTLSNQIPHYKEFRSHPFPQPEGDWIFKCRRASGCTLFSGQFPGWVVERNDGRVMRLVIEFGVFWYGYRRFISFIKIYLNRLIFIRGRCRNYNVK